MSEDADLIELQTRAFDEQAALSSSSLVCNGKSATVISSPTIHSRRLTETGYLPGDVSSFEIKRVDFVALNIHDKSDVMLDGKKFRVLVIDNDQGDAIVHLDLGPRR